MELKVFKNTLAAYGGRWETKLELPVETEILVPDYLPAVFKIVKCLIEPVLAQNKVTGTRWQGEGYLRCTVYYQSDEAGSCLCRAEQKFPFEKTVELPSGKYTGGPATVRGELEYCNCRAVSEHRIDLRGAYAIGVSVSAVSDQELITALADCGIEQRTANLETVFCAAAEEKTFTADATAGLPGVGETILDVDGYAAQESVTVQTDQINWQGALHMQISYRPAGGGELATLQKEIAVRQTLELPGAAEGDDCFAWGEVLASTLSAPEGGEGDPVLSVTWKLHAENWRKAEYTAVCDAYSTLCNTETEPSKIRLLEQLAVVQDTVRAEIVDDLPGDGMEIKGCFVELGAIGAAQCAGGETITLCGKGGAHLICADARGELVCLDKTFEWALPQQWAAALDQVVPHAAAAVTRVSTGKEGGRVKAEIEIAVTGVVLQAIEHTMVGEIALGEEFPEKASGPALYLYYAGEGESLFDIAKRYHAHPKEIACANQLEGDQAEKLQDLTVKKSCLLVPAAL